MGRWITHDGRHIYVNSAGQPTTPPAGAGTSRETNDAHESSRKANDLSSKATSPEGHKAAAAAHKEAVSHHAYAEAAAREANDSVGARLHKASADSHDVLSKRHAEYAKDNGGRKAYARLKSHKLPDVMTDTHPMPDHDPMAGFNRGGRRR